MIMWRIGIYLWHENTQQSVDQAILVHDFCHRNVVLLALYRTMTTSIEFHYPDCYCWKDYAVSFFTYFFFLFCTLQNNFFFLFVEINEFTCIDSRQLLDKGSFVRNKRIESQIWKIHSTDSSNTSYSPVLQNIITFKFIHFDAPFDYFQFFR